MNKMRMTLNRDKSRLIVTIEGELDASNCINAEKQFEKALVTDASAIYIDCSRLTYISSAGIGALISVHHACTQKGIPIYFCEMQPKVQNVLSILGLDRLFNIESSLKEALGAAPPSN